MAATKEINLETGICICFGRIVAGHCTPIFNFDKIDLLVAEATARSYTLISILILDVLELALANFGETKLAIYICSNYMYLLLSLVQL